MSFTVDVFDNPYLTYEQVRDATNLSELSASRVVKGLVLGPAEPSTMNRLASVQFSLVAATALLRSSIWRQRGVGEVHQNSTEGLSTVHKPGLQVAQTAECNRP